MNANARAALERYDEPGAYEFPRNFNYERLELKAAAVVKDLRDSGLRLTFEGASHNQDAAFCIGLILNDFEHKQGSFSHLPIVRFSNFGNLVSISGAIYFRIKYLGRLLALWKGMVLLLFQRKSLTSHMMG